MAYQKIARGLQEAIDFARATMHGKDDCLICKGSGYKIDHIRYPVNREWVEYENWKPCDCLKH